jgi:GH15 family glucan-1,4-alpha-glucosidase
VAAAATTSLPEYLGGVRNWDYRYCWVRDAALSAHALVDLESTSEALRYLDWLLGVLQLCDSPERLQPLYTLLGEPPGPEAEIAELNGYAGSRPVRIGNAASRQIQLDVFGPVVDLIAALLDRGAPLSSEHWRLVETMVKAVERRWQEPDHGIWEVRLPRRHHVHSKVMCWLTVDRALIVAREFRDEDPPGWRALRTAIAEDVLERGYDERVGAFTAAYGESVIDAASLQVGLSGLLPPDDPRFAGTVEAVERELLDGPSVYRYRIDDGLPGHEGAFHLCTSWLIDSYLLLGRDTEARELFEGLISLVGPTGLLSEQYDPVSGRALGNTPQAYSHLGLIRNAMGLSRSGKSK